MKKDKNNYLYYLSTVLTTELHVLEMEIERVKLSIAGLEGIADKFENAFDEKEDNE